VVGALTARAFAVISPSSHHRQWSGAIFKISGELSRFLSQLNEDQKSKVRGLAPHYFYHRGKLKRPFGTHAQDSSLHARHLDPFTT
jgi:hypothetical protein